MCKSEHRRTCSKVCGKKGANSRRGFLCEMWGLRVVSNPSTQPYPLNLSSSSFARPDSRGRLSPHGRLWRVLPVELLSRVPHPSSAWVGILTVESMAPIFFECHTRNASRVPLIQASRESGICGETLACSFCHLPAPTLFVAFAPTAT
jgi:hypothetical protein